jgi:DNA-binding beta-propeller fold protein YncE
MAKHGWHSVTRFKGNVCLSLAVLLTAFLVPSVSAQYIYVANAGEDTVSKIDINTNTEVARYATWFTTGSPNHVVHPNNPGAGPAPSRLLQDPAGNLYVLNRFFSPPHLPVLLKIAPTGGIPGVTTSNGSIALPITDTLPTNNQMDPGEATDVRIKWAKEIGTGADVGALGRALCMDTSGVLWVGMYQTERYYKVDPATGNMLAPLTGIPTPGHKPYGCQVDAKGKLWSVDARKTLAQIDNATNQVTIHNHGSPTDFGTNYSLSLFNSCDATPGKVYLSHRPGKTYIAYDPLTSSFSAAPLGIPQLNSIAIAVDRNANIVSGQHTTTGRIIKTSPTGAVLWDTNTLPAGPAVLPATDVHGIIIDAQDDIWVVYLGQDQVVKYSGVDGHWIATVKVGDAPYTYGNPPPPNCPCAEIREQSITCDKQSSGIPTYAWSFSYTNHSPYLTSATGINISSSHVTNLTPAQVTFTNPVPPNGQAPFPAPSR